MESNRRKAVVESLKLHCELHQLQPMWGQLELLVVPSQTPGLHRISMMQVQHHTSFPYSLLILHWTELVMVKETLGFVVALDGCVQLTTSRLSWGEIQRMAFHEPRTRSESKPVAIPFAFTRLVPSTHVHAAASYCYCPSRHIPARE